MLRNSICILMACAALLAACSAEGLPWAATATPTASTTPTPTLTPTPTWTPTPTEIPIPPALLGLMQEMETAGMTGYTVEGNRFLYNNREVLRLEAEMAVGETIDGEEFSVPVEHLRVNTRERYEEYMGNGSADIETISRLVLVDDERTIVEEPENLYPEGHQVPWTEFVFTEGKWFEVPEPRVGELVIYDAEIRDYFMPMQTSVVRQRAMETGQGCTHFTYQFSSFRDNDPLPQVVTSSWYNPGDISVSEIGLFGERHRQTDEMLYGYNLPTSHQATVGGERQTFEMVISPAYDPEALRAIVGDALYFERYTPEAHLANLAGEVREIKIAFIIPDDRLREDVVSRDGWWAIVELAEGLGGAEVYYFQLFDMFSTRDISLKFIQDVNSSVQPAQSIRIRAAG